MPEHGENCAQDLGMSDTGLTQDRPSLMPADPEFRASLHLQSQAANNAAREAVKARGVGLHPRVAALKAKRKIGVAEEASE